MTESLPPKLGMWVSLGLGFVTAAVVFGALGVHSALLTIVGGFVFGGLFWAILRPVFFYASGAFRYVFSSSRREFKRAWKKLGCAAAFEGGELEYLWHQSPQRNTLFGWLFSEWGMECIFAKVPAEHWLAGLLSAEEDGRVEEVWNARPVPDDVRRFIQGY